MSVFLLKTLIMPIFKEIEEGRAGLSFHFEKERQLISPTLILKNEDLYFMLLTLYNQRHFVLSFSGKVRH
jgi:hypothetical protein